MQGLIGDRFLKRFFGSRPHRHTASPAGEAITLPETDAEMPTEPGCLPNEDRQKKEPTLENKDTGEIKELASPENGSDHPANDH